MKKLLLSFIFLFILSGHAFATIATTYVSNVASHGYALGNDSNTCATPALACLTIIHAVSLTSSGGTVIINPTSNNLTTANNPYLETTQVSLAGKTMTVEGDPAYVNNTAGSLAVVVVQSSGSTDVILSGSSAVLTASDLILDCQSTASKRAWKGLAETSITWTRVNPVNCVTFPFSSFTGGDFIIDRFTLDASNLYASASGVFNFGSMASGTVMVKGGTFNSPYQTAGSHFPIFYTGAGTLTSFTTTTDVNGLGPVVSGDTEFIAPSTSTIGTLELDNVTATNAYMVVTFGACNITTIFNAKNNTVVDGALSNSSGGNSPFIGNIPEGVVLGEFSGNTVTSSSGNSLFLNNGTGSPNVFGNRLTYNNTSHNFQLGTDGFTIDKSNTATTTGGQNLGDIGGDKYVDQFVTTSAYSTTHSSYIAEAIVTLKSQGSPTGNITCLMYADNAGNPGALLDTSTTTLSMTSLTSSYQQFAFEFNGVYVAPSTKVHFVFVSSTTDVSNYVLMSQNTTTTIGSILTSTLGSIWVANTSNALLFYLNVGSYGIVDAKVHDNILLSTIDPTISNITHMIAMGAQTRGKVYRNLVIGGSLGIMFKENKGGSATNPAIASGNLLYLPYGGSSTVAPLYCKASQYVDFYNNTVIGGSTDYGSIVTVGPDANSFGYLPINALQSNNVNIRNNILVQNNSAVQVYTVTQNGLSVTPSNLNIDHNDVYTPNGGNIGQLLKVTGASSSLVTTYADWTAWTGAGYDVAGSITTNPLLVNSTTPSAATDFQPSNSSPVLAIGINLNGLALHDYNTHPFFSIPDMGGLNIAYHSSQSRATATTRSTAATRN